MIEPILPVSIEQTRRDIADVRAKLNISSRRPLEPLRAALARATSKAVIDPSHRPELVAAEQALADEERNHDNIQALNARMVELERVLAAAQHAERMALVERANRRLAQAIDDYQHSAKACCRSYHAMLQQLHRNEHTPGAKTAIPVGPDFPHLTPEGWLGRTGDHIASGSLSWLNEGAS